VSADDERSCVDEALRLLGIERLVLSIHDASFPSDPEEEIGRGSPYSHGARGFLRFARELGFSGLQLGPQGKTSRINPSPYDGTIFTRSALSLALAPLAAGPHPLLSPRHLERLVASCPVATGSAAASRVDHAFAWNAAHGALSGVHERFCAERAVHANLDARFSAYLERAFRTGSPFERDAVFELLSLEHGGDDWRRWPEGDRDLYLAEDRKARMRIKTLRAARAHDLERFTLGQFLLHEQHSQLRADAASLGLTLYGDLQAGMSQQDLWAWRGLCLRDYKMGAPPSRTNPEGQPWGYPVLDPAQMFAADGNDGPGRALMRARGQKLLAEFDGVRIDHPHAWVCPWVYRSDQPDEHEAVRAGARLYSSPALPDHPALAPFAIATAADLNPAPGTPRHVDDWVVALSPEQVSRYGAAIELLLQEAEALGRRRQDILCEVLSTWPRPLEAVMKRHGLGRFCVTQKADPDNPHDMYRSETTASADWIMVGNHDTKPIWSLLDEWRGTPHAARRAAYLAQRLCPDESQRAPFASNLISSPAAFATAMFAELFASPAVHVAIFFADLLGIKDIYNRPGVVDDRNWTLRVPRDYAQVYGRRRAAGGAADLRRALSMALIAKVRTPDARALATRLAALSP
jgi:4-alpha-glucanotransferase